MLHRHFAARDRQETGQPRFAGEQIVERGVQSPLAPPGIRWQKSGVVHRKGIAAPCRVPTCWIGRSIPSICASCCCGVLSRAGRLRCQLVEPRAHGLEERPVRRAAVKCQQRRRAAGFPRSRCFAARTSPRAPRAGIRATTSPNDINCGGDAIEDFHRPQIFVDDRIPGSDLLRDLLRPVSARIGFGPLEGMSQ